MLIPDFLLYALLSALAIATVAGPLGSLIVWRRLAYFGDTLAHGALLGIAVGLFAEINLLFAVIACCLLLAGMLFSLQRSASLGGDALLGILSHSALAAGLVGISFADVSVDLFAYLLGDLLTTSAADSLLVAGCCTAVLAILVFLWKPLLAITIDKSLAKTDGLPVPFLEVLLLGIIALVVAFAMQVVGVLLITAMLIIPASAARYFAKSPESMAIIGSLFGWIAVAGGMLASYWYNTPAGPSIVLAASLIFSVSLFVSKVLKW